MQMDIFEDEMFATNPKRVENRDKLIAIMQDVFKQKTVHEWIQLFEGADIPCGPVNKISDILNDQHVIEREMVVRIGDKKMGSFETLGIPLKLSRTPGTIQSRPPQLGEHTEIILKHLGYSVEEMQALEAAQVIRRGGISMQNRS